MPKQAILFAFYKQFLRKGKTKASDNKKFNKFNMEHACESIEGFFTKRSSGGALGTRNKGS
jgi:hypothetical protein